MFDFDDFDEQLEKADAAIESLLSDIKAEEELEIANEGLFSKPKSLDQLLSQVQRTVDKRCKTEDDCNDLMAKLKVEEDNFNSAIQSLQDATKQYQEDQDKKALQSTVRPILKGLKKTCSLLKMKDIAEDPKTEITDDEIQKLRDFIIGSREIIENKIGTFNGGEKSMESFMDFLQEDEALEGYTLGDFMEFAMEGVIDPDVKKNLRIRFGEASRELKNARKQAMSAKKEGKYDEAITLLQKEKKGWQGLLATAKKMSDKASGYADASGARTHGSVGKTNAINFCIKKIGECEDQIEAIKDKQIRDPRKAAEKEASQARKAQRKENRAARRAARKNKKSAETDADTAAEAAIMIIDDALAAMESFTGEDDDYDDYSLASESLFENGVDDYDYAMEAALDGLRRTILKLCSALSKKCSEKAKTVKKESTKKKLESLASWFQKVATNAGSKLSEEALQKLKVKVEEHEKTAEELMAEADEENGGYMEPGSESYIPVSVSAAYEAAVAYYETVKQEIS